MNSQILLSKSICASTRPASQPSKPARFGNPTALRSYKPASPALREALTPLDESPALPVTPTLRLLEVSCGLTYEQAQRLLKPRPIAPTIPLSVQAEYTKFNRGFQEIAWAFFIASFGLALLQMN